jgi:hypothetical protein
MHCVQVIEVTQRGLPVQTNMSSQATKALAFRVYWFRERWPELIGTLVVTTTGRKAILTDRYTPTITQQLAGVQTSKAGDRKGEQGAGCIKADFLSMLRGCCLPQQGGVLQLESLLAQLLPNATSTDLAFLKVCMKPVVPPEWHACCMCLLATCKLAAKGSGPLCGCFTCITMVSVP